MKKDVFVTECNFDGFVDSITYGGIEGLDFGMFARELKGLMEKYKIKEIYPTHRNNAQISRHITDDEIHIVGIYFKSE
jgi:hypothetical protein